jgi:hypothetical protein
MEEVRNQPQIKVETNNLIMTKKLLLLKCRFAKMGPKASDQLKNSALGKDFPTKIFLLYMELLAKLPNFPLCLYCWFVMPIFPAINSGKRNFKHLS